MKEVTMVVTCQFTDHAVVPDDTVIPPEGCVPPYFELVEDLKKNTGADDVDVKLVQFFVRDLPNESEVVVGTP